MGMVCRSTWFDVSVVEMDAIYAEHTTQVQPKDWCFRRELSLFWVNEKYVKKTICSGKERDGGF